MTTRRFLSSLILLLLCSAGFAQDVEVSVDRSELARGETLVFTIRVFDQRQGMQLDLTPLTENFDVLGTRTSSQIRSINGAVEAWTDYIVTLFPLEEGVITIPSLTINNIITDAVDITVSNQGPRSNQASEELFLEIEVNKESVYVQEQLLFSVRLFYTINGIRNPQFTELEMEDSVIQLIGSPNQYEKLIDGVRYGVYEKRYVIFPQRSGPLEIPDILFRGEVTDGSSNFVFRNLNTRRVTAFIDGITVDIKERPNAALNSEFWLPVTDLRLEESWSTDINDLEIGESAVRTVAMVADGLDGAVLPPFLEADIEGVNQYPEPADIQRTFVDGSIVGTRIETVSIVPTESGFIDIPEVSIPWWNVESDQQEVTVIPATRLTIPTTEGDLPAEQSVASTANIEEVLDNTPVLDLETIEEQADAEYIEVDSFWLNALIAGALAIVALSIYKIVISPRQQEIGGFFSRQANQINEKFIPANNENAAFNQLKSACAKRDLKKIRTDLIVWCNHYFDGQHIRTMEDILNQEEELDLAHQAKSIQTALFTPENSNWKTENLLKIVQNLRNKKKKYNKEKALHEKYALPPLYRT
ncbi:MAG: BatD family protein [Pseudohongiellaceae bacterium]